MKMKCGGTISVAQGTVQLGVLVLFLLAVGWPNPANFHVYASKEGEIVASWAQKFGEELWNLGEVMTKSKEIRMKYKSYNARVEHKGNETLIKSIVENVGRMLQRKIDAVRCILAVAEETSEQFDANDTDSNITYYSSKYSPVDGMTIEETAMAKDDPMTLPEVVLNHTAQYLPMWLNQDTHFFNISVNTTHSSVHVPTNVYDRWPHVLEAIRWSEALDNVFVQNYQSDPALSWQYFGSDTGIMRHYPAKIWESKNKVDMYDCRKRSWYIETATCSKDIVILLDNSGSMTGFRNYIAQLTIKSILDTFSNNDFINIYNYSNTVTELVPCFNNTLVQATPENIAVFNDAVRGLKPFEYANVSLAFVRAFELLEMYRTKRKCNESSTGCNQAIMLITDGVPGNLTDVFEQYNWLENGNLTRTPVRIFTYLIGREVTKVREIQWMACLNRGYYSHVQTLDQVQSEVLKYVTVIATPLVLQGVDHPPTWTHAFRDEAHPKDEEVRLMIAVGVPAFDRKLAKQGNGTRRSARLLGVASTDVPVEDINKLTLPYKLGVNGYSFVVSNNGYVLLHPDLRPVEDKQLKINYNSIDLTEVEQFNDGVDGRKPGEKLLTLRDALVHNKEGKLINVSVKFHFDDMRRVSVEDYDYYYAPLPNTPFSMGLAIPSGYGNTWIKVGDEVRRNIHMNINMSNYFVGDNWKVHPEWVYCKYHYLEDHEFNNTPETELRHFLKKMAEPTWKWSQQYEPEPESDSEDSKSNEPNCGRKTFDTEAYYCNKELVQLLIFDAKVTNASYRSWKFDTDADRDLIEMYNATLRFVATMSGLTRWQFIHGEVEVENDKEFGDYHTKAVDETWYKMAILQHHIDPKSFVYSVAIPPYPLGTNEFVMTASHAIFPRDGGIEAPGSVVGFQFSHEKMLERFMEITSQVNCDGCIKPCADDMQDCYVLDSNGYVVLSEHDNDTGAYFGELDGTGAIMASMIEQGIYRQVSIYDFQAHCTQQVLKLNDADSMITPFRLLALAAKWLFYELYVFLQRMDLWVQGMPYYDDDTDYNGDGGATHPPKSSHKNIYETEETYFSREIVQEYETLYEACDKQINLTVLQQNLFIDGHNLPSLARSNCSRPYYFNRIPHSNLLLVVVDASYSTCALRVNSQPTKMEYEQEFPCYKLSLNDLSRRRLDECFTEHPEEANVTYCGLGTNIKLTMAAVFWSIVYTVSLRLAH